jgi:hypothetical protein
LPSSAQEQQQHASAPAVISTSQSQPQEQQPQELQQQQSSELPIDLSLDEENEDDFNTALDAKIPTATLKYEAETSVYLSALYGTNLKSIPESRDLNYGGKTHKLNSFHYRGSSRAQDTNVESSRTNGKKAYIDTADDTPIIYRWEVMGCLTTHLKHKVIILFVYIPSTL